VLDAFPDDGNSMDTYAWVLFRQKKYAEAQKLLSRAMKSGQENNGAVLEHYGDVLYQSGDTTGALLYWKKAKENHVVSETIDDKIAGKNISRSVKEKQHD